MICSNDTLGSRIRLLALGLSQDGYGLKIGRERLNHIYYNISIYVYVYIYQKCSYGVIYSDDFLYISMIFYIFR